MNLCRYRCPGVLRCAGCSLPLGGGVLKDPSRLIWVARRFDINLKKAPLSFEENPAAHEVDFLTESSLFRYFLVRNLSLQNGQRN